MNKWLILFVFLYLAKLAFDFILDLVNHRHLIKHGEVVPPEFEGEVDFNLLKKSKCYSIEKFNFGLFSTIFDEALVLIFILAGFLNLYNSWLDSLKLPFILSGFLFFILLSLGKSLLDIPFNIYDTFKIEKKFNFNTMTPKLWIVDFIKSMVLTVIIMGILICGALWLVHSLENLWWLAVWVFFLVFSIFILYISPYVLEPLFNKFTPVDDEELEKGIKEVMSKAGLKISRVFKMDASKRTKHTNAYFSGIGKVKRIVLYDTLIDGLTKDEILAVLAHEAGHWKKKHIIKNLILFEIIALIGAYAAFIVMKSNFLAEVFYIDNPTFVVKLFILNFAASPLLYLIHPMICTISRKYEREADDYAMKLVGTGEDLATALIKLSKDNLSNLHPHPIYAKFHYSHPPATERIRYLRSFNSR